MFAVLRDLELTTAWDLPPDRETLIGAKGSREKPTVAVEDWSVGLVQIHPAGDAWTVRSPQPPWGFQTRNGMLAVRQRVMRTLGETDEPLESGDVLFLGRETAMLFLVEDERQPDALDAIVAARPLYDATRAALAAGAADWAERIARRFSECRETARAEALLDLASAAALASGEPRSRPAAVVILGELGRLLPEAVRPLRLLLSDPDRELRVATARALARIGGPHVVDALGAAVADADDRVFLTALAAIERSRDRAFRPALFTLLRDARGKRREHLERAISELSAG